MPLWLPHAVRQSSSTASRSLFGPPCTPWRLLSGHPVHEPDGGHFLVHPASVLKDHFQRGNDVSDRIRHIWPYPTPTPTEVVPLYSPGGLFNSEEKRASNFDPLFDTISQIFPYCYKTPRGGCLSRPGLSRLGGCFGRPGRKKRPRKRDFMGRGGRDGERGGRIRRTE